jgi:hypothetical protein
MGIALSDYSDRVLVDFLARENRRSRKLVSRELALLARRRGLELCPRVGPEDRRSSSCLDGSSVSRPTSCLGQGTCPLGTVGRPRCTSHDRSAAWPDGGTRQGSVLSVGSCGIRKKTRGRAGTPDAGALLFKDFWISGWGYRVTPGVSPGELPFGSQGQSHSNSIPK